MIITVLQAVTERTIRTVKIATLCLTAVPAVQGAALQATERQIITISAAYAPVKGFLTIAGKKPQEADTAVPAEKSITNAIAAVKQKPGAIRHRQLII